MVKLGRTLEIRVCTDSILVSFHSLTALHSTVKHCLMCTTPVLDNPVVFVVGGAVPDHQHPVVETVCTTAAVSVDTT